MKPIPDIVGGAQVVCYSPIDDHHRYTGNCKRYRNGELLEPMSGLAICRYPGEHGFYLFGCDREWNTVTDTWHETLDDARAQAEFEYEGIERTWMIIEQPMTPQ